MYEQVNFSSVVAQNQWIERVFNLTRGISKMCKEYKCDFCPNSYTRKDNLKSHIKEVHHGKKKMCDVCDLEVRSSSLRRHEKSLKHVQMTRTKALKQQQNDEMKKEDKLNEVPNAEGLSFISENDPFLGDSYDISEFLIID